MCCDSDNASEQYGAQYCSECVPWNGEEASLPTGGQIRAEGVFIWDLVERWKCTKTGKVIGAVMDENSIKTIIETYGARGIVISKSSTTGLLTRSQWKRRYHTDGLVLWAIRESKRIGTKIVDQKKVSCVEEVDYKKLKDDEINGHIAPKDYLAMLEKLKNNKEITEDYYEQERIRILKKPEVIPDKSKTDGEANWKELKDDEINGRITRQDYLKKLRKLKDNKEITEKYYEQERQRIINEMK